MTLPNDIKRLLDDADRTDKEKRRKSWERVKGSGIKWDLWHAAFAAHLKHVLNPKLLKHNVFTLVDFRLPSSKPRLWVVELNKKEVFGPVRVSHGSGSANEGRKAEFFFPKKGAHTSMVGAYATFGNTIQTKAGQTEANKALNKKDIGLQVYGLDPGVNSNAVSRQILFHGAWYVSSHNAGNSKGCFATTWTINRQIISKIKGGTFVFAYAGGEVAKELANEYRKAEKLKADRLAHDKFWRSLDL
jgi:hypothetical protein